MSFPECLLSTEFIFLRETRGLCRRGQGGPKTLSLHGSTASPGHAFFGGSKKPEGVGGSNHWGVLPRTKSQLRVNAREMHRGTHRTKAPE